MKTKHYLFITLFVGAIAVQKGSGQDRTWTDVDGRKIIARPVGKDSKSLQLRMPDGKRVPVPLARLSAADREWLDKWEPPKFTVEAKTRDFKGNFGVGEVREFEFRSGPRMRAVVFEDEIPAFIKAIHDFFALAEKSTPDVTAYEKTLHEGKAHGSTSLWPLIVFSVKDGTIRCGGGKLTSEDGSRGMNPQELMKLLDFLEGFSVADWDQRQERIKRQFE